MLWQMTVVAVMALKVTEEPRTVQLTRAPIVITMRAAFLGVPLSLLSLRSHDGPGSMLSREITNVTL